MTAKGKEDPRDYYKVGQTIRTPGGYTAVVTVVTKNDLHVKWKHLRFAQNSEDAGVRQIIPGMPSFYSPLNQCAECAHLAPNGDYLCKWCREMLY